MKRKMEVQDTKSSKKLRGFDINFEDIKVSTQTIIVDTNVKFKIADIYKCLQQTKKKIEIGDVMRIKYKGNHKDITLDENVKLPAKKSNGFRNALTVVVYMRMKCNKKMIPKCVNMKMSCNGKLQITGSQNINDAVLAVKSVWRLIKSQAEKLYEPLNVKFKAVFEIVMTNIDFNIGFKINRNALNKYINDATQNRSLLEDSFGYTGANLKFPMVETLDHNMLLLSEDGGMYQESYIKYQDFIKNLSVKATLKLRAKKRYNTFLVFHSGNIIMSGKMKHYMKKSFKMFMGIMKSKQNLFREQLRA